MSRSGGGNRGGSVARSSNSGRPGGAQAGNRSGSPNRSNFVARNFSNQGRGNQGVGNLGGANRGNFSRGGSSGGIAGRNSNSFVSRNFSNSGRGRGDGPGNNFNRGNFSNSNSNRGNFSNYYRGNNNNWGKNDWGKNNWGGNNWNHGNWGHNNWNNNWGGNNWYGGGFNRGWGYGGWGGYGRYPFWGWGFYPGWGLWGLYGLGFGLGYGGWGGYGGYGSSYGYDNYASNPIYYTDNYANNAVAAVPQSSDILPATPAVDDYDTRGEQAFRSADYEGAIRAWQHAMVDDPNNGALVALMAQALFAIGQYDSAAGTVQTAMQMLPETEWGSVVKNYSQLYGNIGDYTTQLKALENARDAKPDNPALRFLLGYHFGYLGYPKQAVRELDKALDLQSQDLGSQKLRDIFAVQAGLPARAPAAPQRAPAQPPQPGPGAPVPASPVPRDVPGENAQAPAAGTPA